MTGLGNIIYFFIKEIDHFCIGNVSTIYRFKIPFLGIKNGLERKQHQHSSQTSNAQEFR